MKNLRLITLVTALAALTVDFSIAQKLPQLDASPADIAIFRPDGQGSAPVAKVVYGRPQKKGRTILGGLEKYGKVWRTGANETTEIKLYKDVTVGDKMVKAGTYSLYTIPDKDKWVIIFNSKLDTWGAFEYDESKDVARVEVPAETSDKEVEAFTIAFDGKGGTGNMVLAWENTLVKVPLKY
ncbi:MAG: DUF2911 domain-containing protein [Cyclobacteriaceae bacterium]|nr:DUF2911 domain-containing protein [Cyclobacteriaceae bacterium]MCB0499658.1 DUF2911 domain-containing protein [Cyclobacteriaceae bacterium]MCB9239417.1 DUF2911 domain-containing protein [Flammeovirgaceae bacterium]MCO5271200.1 DUF2911 domain-containing protein [Cyclobacteriaceae bacterium]MCW5902594.1 DUF2911 domain-containing protein [Cyclobacteriaceae bacterium]